MHPQLVAGAWAGFNDNRVTMGDRWGPGAQSALPMIGAFFQQAIKAGLVDEKRNFSAPRQSLALQASALPQESAESGEPVAPGADAAPENDRGARSDLPNDLPTVILSPPLSRSPLQPVPAPAATAAGALPESGRLRPGEPSASIPAPGSFPRPDAGPAVATPVR